VDRDYNTSLPGRRQYPAGKIKWNRPGPWWIYRFYRPGQWPACTMMVKKFVYYEHDPWFQVLSKMSIETGWLTTRAGSGSVETGWNNSIQEPAFSPITFRHDPKKSKRTLNQDTEFITMILRTGRAFFFWFGTRDSTVRWKKKQTFIHYRNDQNLNSLKFWRGSGVIYETVREQFGLELDFIWHSKYWRIKTDWTKKRDVYALF